MLFIEFFTLRIYQASLFLVGFLEGNFSLTYHFPDFSAHSNFFRGHLVCFTFKEYIT